MSSAPGVSSRPHHPRKVRAAQKAMFPEDAHALLDSVREVLCQPTRAKIIRALMGAELTVGDLGRVIDRSKSLTSQHLNTLRALGVVRSWRRGRRVYNALADAAIAAAASQVLECVADISAGPSAPA